MNELCINITEAQVNDTEKFFCKMRVGVKILQPDMFGNKPFAIMQKSNLTIGDEEKSGQQRVFKHDDSGNIHVHNL